MIRIVFLGFGNVNFNLCKAFDKVADISVIQIFNRNNILINSPLNTIPFTSNYPEVMDADVYIIGVPDDSILSFSETLPFENKLVVHTSGGGSMDSLSGKNRKGVLYPLQTFSKNREVKFSEIPICIEAENDDDLDLLKRLANSISGKVVVISSEERAQLHLAAVFVNNFTNYLYDVASEILTENKLPFELLKPLIAETARKIENLSPAEAQTGPARRNDLKTIQKHLHLLENSPHKKLYEQFTQALQEKFDHNDGKKL